MATSGICGKNLTWTLNSGVLAISGSGAMYDYDEVAILGLGGQMLGNVSPWRGPDVTSVVIGDSVTSIGKCAFCDCYMLASVTIPLTVTSIGDKAFYWCESLSSVSIPQSVTSIGGSVFYGCTSLSSIAVASANSKYEAVSGVLFNKGRTALVAYPAGRAASTYTIPSTVASVSDYAFAMNASLATVNVPSSATSIGEGAFIGCTSLESIQVSQDSQSYCSENGVLFNKGRTELVAYPAGSASTSYVIPDSVTSILKYAFAACPNLAYVKASGPLASIGENAFSSCASLASADLGNSMTSIGSLAFSGCTSLTSFSFGNFGVDIGAFAFSGCTSLVSVTVVNSATNFGSGAFNGCTRLSHVNVRCMTPPEATSMGSDYFNGATVTIPYGAYPAFAARAWGSFTLKENADLGLAVYYKTADGWKRGIPYYKDSSGWKRAPATLIKCASQIPGNSSEFWVGHNYASKTILGTYTLTRGATYDNELLWVGVSSESEYAVIDAPNADVPGVVISIANPQTKPHYVKGTPTVSGEWLVKVNSATANQYVKIVVSDPEEPVEVLGTYYLEAYVEYEDELLWEGDASLGGTGYIMETSPNTDVPGLTITMNFQGGVFAHKVSGYTDTTGEWLVRVNESTSTNQYVKIVISEI